MPTTSSGDTVYADPSRLADYVQTSNESFGLSTTADGDGASPWLEFLETIQARMKARIDEYTGRDFEDHSDDTLQFDGGATSSRFLSLPEPVRSVTEVRVDGDVVDPGTYRWKESGQLIRLDPSDSSARASWPAGYGNIAVDLDWGYQSPPADVVEAELKLVSHTVAGLAQMREGMVVQQDDVDLQVALPEAMTTEVKNILRHHRSSGRSAGVI